MKTLYKNLTVLGILAGITLTSLPTRSEPTNTVSELARGNNTFALELYGKLKSKEGNLFFSPYSVSSCLGMVYAGARGETEKQMANTLHFSTNQTAVHAGFGALQKELNEKAGATLKVANALLVQKGLPFDKDFLDCITQTYQAFPMQFDFRTQAQLASDELNRWVAERTEGNIQKIMGPEQMGGNAGLMVANAMYFKGKWADPFSEEQTKPIPFDLANGGTVTAQMMGKSAYFGYFENSELKALELPYAGRKLSMVVLLPNYRQGLATLESTITTDKVSAWVGLMQDKDVIVQLPKFKMEKEFDLTGPLGELGLRDALCSKADFSGISGSDHLYISEVLHTSFVEVNEKGTEAAAVTSVRTIMIGIGLEEPPKKFIADHPFLFVIRDNDTGSILFMGRVMDPTQ
jgi:serine protease inhibitor